MDIQKFFSLLSVFVGLSGGLLLYNSMREKNETILRSTPQYSPLTWPSSEMIENLAHSKANLVMGFIALLMACVLQIVSIFVPDTINFSKNLWIGIAIAFFCGGAFFVSLFCIQKGYGQYIALQMKKISVRDYLTDHYKEWSNRGVDEGVEGISKDYFGLFKKPDQTWKDYIIDVAKRADWKLPPDLDLTKIKEPPQ